MIFKNNKITKSICTICIIAILCVSLLTAPLQVKAQLTVPIGTGFDFQSIMAYTKDFVLDKLAVMLANQILQKMTASVVGWINSGFQGSPAFLQNPEAFFLDAADQVTGAFLLGSPLSALCSPISLDLRLSLALSQTQMLSDRYTCTLKKIIEAQKNGPDITINGQVINSSQEGFLAGDFNQGGWPAFMALTTEHQNNPYGAFLMAQSDLNVAISERKIAIKADLQMGSGFMSWNKCTDLAGGANISADEDITLYDEVAKTDPTVTVKSNKDGTLTYQSCQTQTPGSVIGNTLQKQLDVPTDKLVLVKTISDSIDAILGALVNQMLTKGLASLSGGGSAVGGDSRAYLRQLQDEANAQRDGVEWQTAENDLRDALDESDNGFSSLKAIYDEAVLNVANSRNKMLTARSCFVNKIDDLVAGQNDQRKYAQNKISAIDNYVENQITPLLASLVAKQTAVAELIEESKPDNSQSADEWIPEQSEDIVGESFAKFQSRVSVYKKKIQTNTSQSTVSTVELEAAQKSLKSAKTDATKFNKAADEFQASCDIFPARLD